MFVSAIQLNLSNHSFGFSVSVPLNFASFTKLPSLGIYSPLIFIPVKTFTNAATFESNPPRLLLFSELPLPPGDPPGLPPSGGPPAFPPPNPPPNPGGKFWVLSNPNP